MRAELHWETVVRGIESTEKLDDDQRGKKSNRIRRELEMVYNGEGLSTWTAHKGSKREFC